MKTIWKFKLALTDVQEIMIPVGAQLLTAQVQFGEVLMLWALVDPLAAQSKQRIFIHGAGHPVHQDAARYLGTVQLEGGGMVFHVFVEQRK